MGGPNQCPCTPTWPAGPAFGPCRAAIRSSGYKAGLYPQTCFLPAPAGAQPCTKAVPAGGGWHPAIQFRCPGLSPALGEQPPALLPQPCTLQDTPPGPLTPWPPQAPRLGKQEPAWNSAPRSPFPVLGAADGPRVCVCGGDPRGDPQHPPSTKICPWAPSPPVWPGAWLHLEMAVGGSCSHLCPPWGTSGRGTAHTVYPEPCVFALPRGAGVPLPTGCGRDPSPLRG